MGTTTERLQVNRECYMRMPGHFQSAPNLLQQVYERQVVLEDMFTRSVSVYGTVRVNNLSFAKRVFVRYSIDRWKTCSNIDARHSTFHSDTNTNSFQFKLTISGAKRESLPATSISFAIGYRVAGQEFWDNNSLRNYNLEIVSSASSKDSDSTVHQSSIHRSIVRNDEFERRIARDYHAVANTSQQAGALCGLKNLGGTCYMNSVVQSLFLTSPLTDDVLDQKHRRSSSSYVSAETMENEYSNLVYLLSTGEYSVLTASPFKQVLGHLNNIYLENQQQDAHEFLLLLLDYLHTDLTLMRLTNEDGKIEYSSVEQINTGSIIEDLFHGTYKSTTTCLKCLQSSSSFEPFTCLSLPIPSTQQCTLEDCLSQFNMEEYLTDDSKWFCSKCEQLCHAKRRVEIAKLPKILIIQLKRFELDSKQNWIKSDALVLYPMDDLDLQQYYSSECTGNIRYTLYSVINHSGLLHDGHYTTFARDLSSEQSSWFEYDDEKIQRANDERLQLNSKAYLLFYTMRQTSK